MGYIATLGDETHRVEVHETGAGLYRVVIDGREWVIDGRQLAAHTYSLLVDQRSYTVDVTTRETAYTVLCKGENFRVRVVDERRMRAAGPGADEEQEGARDVRAFMPGKVVEILVGVGDKVAKEQGLLVLEAMKMENEVRSPCAGVVREIVVTPGHAVEGGELLIRLE